MRYQDLVQQPVQVAETVETELSEARPRGWAILPATMELYGKRTVTPQQAVATWGDGTIIVCTKEENDGRQRLAFLYTSGDSGYPIGTSSHAFHDQTGGSKGYYTVVNNITFDDNEIVKKDNDIGLDKKASLAVFK